MILKSNKSRSDLPSVLMGINEALSEIAPMNVRFWALQEIWASADSYFGLIAVDFKKTMNGSQKGFVASNEDFLKFIVSPTMIYEGVFIALASEDTDEALFVLENFDSSEWMLETNDQEMIQRLISQGWEESEYAPEYSYYKVI